MSAAEYVDTLAALDLDHAAAAELLAVEVRTSRRYASGERKVMGPAAQLLRYIRDDPGISVQRVFRVLGAKR